MPQTLVLQQKEIEGYEKTVRFSGFRLRVAFIICTNQFAPPKNGHESLKYVTGLPFQMFRWFQNVSLERPEKSYYIYFPSRIPRNIF